MGVVHLRLTVHSIHSADIGCDQYSHLLVYICIFALLFELNIRILVVIKCT